ncbi:MAG: Hpt domain-containing protein [Oscillospiraceae bacterium]|nr:Hpt domain-containing protein [Oscillospiraceae bacterium]
MGLIEDIALIGADTVDGLTRFMDNSALYERMLKKLPQVIEDNPVMPFVRSGDLETALSNAHTLKGVVGNLSLTPLYNNYTEAVNLFRSGETAKAEELLESTLEIQRQFVECIKKYD